MLQKGQIYRVVLGYLQEREGTANGYQVSFGSDENALKLDCGDDCTTL